MVVAMVVAIVVAIVGAIVGCLQANADWSTYPPLPTDRHNYLPTSVVTADPNQQHADAYTDHSRPKKQDYATKLNRLLAVRISDHLLVLLAAALATPAALLLLALLLSVDVLIRAFC